MLLFALAVATAAPVTTPGLGASTRCADAFAPGRFERSADWILGFWSGMNVAANKDIGRGDPKAILLEIGHACADHPEMPLLDATLAVHMRFEKQNR